MREIRLLHFHSYIDADEGLWCLGESSSKGIPLYAALDRVSTQAFFSHSQKPALGLLDALADAVGEGGPMNGWQVHNIGPMYLENDWFKIVLVMVMRDTVEVTKAAVKEGQDSVTNGKKQKLKRGNESASGNGEEEIGRTIDFLAVKKRRLGNGSADTT